MDVMQTFFENMRAVLHSLGDFFIVKTVASWALFTVSYLVGASHLPLLGMLSTLVCIDFATGIWAAFKTGDAIQSRKAVRTAVKWTLYMLMISAAHLTESVAFGSWYLAEITIAFLGATEFISILENVGKAGVAIPARMLAKLEAFRDSQ